MNRMQSLNLSIGPIAIMIRSSDMKWIESRKKEYRQYCVHDYPGLLKTVNVKMFKPQLTGPEEELSVVKSAEGWKIRRFDFRSVTSKDFKSTFLEVSDNKYSFNAWLRIFISLCGLENSGLLIHGAGIAHKGAAYVFAGPSGSGKSSLIRIAGKHRALSDEVVFLYRMGNAIYAASTPFWGELRTGSSKTFIGPLKGFFFLSHGKAVNTRALDKGRAFRKLLVTVLFFTDDKHSVQKMLGSALSAVDSAPSCDFSFSLRSAWKEIKKEMENANDKIQKTK